MKRYFTILILYSLITLFISCTSNDNPTGSTEDPQESFGVIAYCYQPLGAGIHQIFTINENGTDNRKIIESTIGLNHHDWSPDGNRIACVGYVDDNFVTWSIHVFNIDGTGLTRLTNTSNVWDTEPSWSPDGTQISFTRMYPDESREELWIMNADGSNQHYIGIDGFAAKWSPDQTRLIYSKMQASNYDIYTCNIDGTDIQRLTNTTSHETFPIFSPDGDRIAYCFSTGRFNTAATAHTYEIFVMNSDGSNNQQLTVNDSYDGYPRWSPDGTKFTFDSDRHQAEKWEVYIMNIDGSDVRRVTNSPENVTAINAVWKPES